LKANGLINSLEEDAAGPIYESYKLLVDAHLYAEADVVGNALLELMVAAAGNVDVYDIRYHNGDPTDPLQAALGTVLNRQDVMTLLNATGTTSGWTACADSPYFGLEGDIEQSSAFLIPGILAQIPVLIYNGNEVSYPLSSSLLFIPATHLVHLLAKLHLVISSSLLSCLLLVRFSFSFSAVLCSLVLFFLVLVLTLFLSERI
jgi:hypothetical protein